MKKKGSKKLEVDEIADSISDEERELFLNAVCQEFSIENKREYAKEYLGLRDMHGESEKELFLRAVEQVSISFIKEGQKPKPRPLPKKTKTKDSKLINAKLDLHGFNSEQALVALTHFFEKQKNLGSRLVLIIHGKGEGVLRKVAIEFFKRRADVGDYQVAPGKLGGQGAILVWIKK